MPTTRKRPVAPKRTDPDLSTIKGRFGARLNELRAKRKITIAQCCEELGVTPKTWHAWVKGESAPELDRWPQLAETLGVSLRNLLPKS